IEAGSYIPKLQAAKQAALQEAAQSGALNLEMPQNRIEYQRQLGITGFDNDIGKDMSRSEWENDLLDDTGMPNTMKPMVLVYDDHDVHMKVHSDRMKEPSFMSLPSDAQMAYMSHMQEHEQFKQQAMQAQMMQAEAMGMGASTPVPPQAAPGAAPAHQGGQPQSHQEKPKQQRGPTKEMRNSLHQDMMQPAPIAGNSK
ncbi:MAG: hypothetical protein KGL39_51325, partial [Patescibacteria group bacterium]|nr:hypothetical protein [Patescibacteria group bacterium]